MNNNINSLNNTIIGNAVGHPISSGSVNSFVGGGRVIPVSSDGSININSIDDGGRTYSVSNNSQSTISDNQSNNEPTIMIERHYVPISLYRELYGPSSQNNNMNNNQTGQYSAPQQSNITPQQSRLQRRSNRMNVNSEQLYQNLSNLLYGITNTPQTSNIAQTSDIATTPVYGNMYLRMRDSDGNEYTYNTTNNASNTDFFSRLMNPNVSLSDLFTGRNSSTQNTPLTQQEIEDNTTLSNITEISTDEPEMCSICQENYIQNDETREIDNCEHTFHRNCIDEWFRTHNNCPVCRGSVISDY